MGPRGPSSFDGASRARLASIPHAGNGAFAASVRKTIHRGDDAKPSSGCERGCVVQGVGGAAGGAVGAAGGAVGAAVLVGTEGGGAVIAGGGAVIAGGVVAGGGAVIAGGVVAGGGAVIAGAVIAGVVAAGAVIAGPVGCAPGPGGAPGPPGGIGPFIPGGGMLLGAGGVSPPPRGAVSQSQPARPRHSAAKARMEREDCAVRVPSMVLRERSPKGSQRAVENSRQRWYEAGVAALGARATQPRTDAGQRGRGAPPGGP